MIDDAGNSDRDDLKIGHIVYVDQGVKIDEVTLAKETQFQITVHRFTVNNHFPEAVIFSALIEEILQLKDRVEKLERKFMGDESGE